METQIAESIGGPVGVLPRTALLLRILSGAGDHGLRLQDLVTETRLAQPTVHRLLRDLIALDAVTRTNTRRYAIGPAFMEMTLSQPTPSPLREMERTRDILQGLAHEIGDTVYLALRSFSSALYLLRCDGASPIRVFSVEVGEIKPLATSYAGIALLAGLDPFQQSRGIETVLRDMPPLWQPRDPAVIAQRLHVLVGQVRTQGWCGGLPVIPDVAGIACPVPRETGAPVLAITVSAATPRLPPARMVPLAKRLMETALLLSQSGR